MSDFWEVYRQEAAARSGAEVSDAARRERERQAVEAKIQELANALKREERHLLHLNVEVSIGYCGTAEVWNTVITEVSTTN